MSNMVSPKKVVGVWELDNDKVKILARGRDELVVA